MMRRLRVRRMVLACDGIEELCARRVCRACGGGNGARMNFCFNHKIALVPSLWAGPFRVLCLHSCTGRSINFMPLRASTITLLVLASLVSSSCSSRQPEAPESHQSEAPESRQGPRVLSLPELRASLDSEAGKAHRAYLRQRQVEEQARLEQDPVLAEYFQHMRANEYDAAFARISI